MPRLRPCVVLACITLLLLEAIAGAQEAAQQPLDFWLPSGKPSGIPRNDRVWVTFYRARNSPSRVAPAVILLHPLGEIRNEVMREFARFLAARGIAGAVVTLPYHMRRLPPHDTPLRHFAPADIVTGVQAYAQAIADVRVVTDWLERRPEVDPARIGVIGVSLGAIVAHSAMGEDPRLSAGVAILGGGDLPDLYRRSALYRVFHPGITRPLTADERAALARVDPLTTASRNLPRRVLMIEAARDLLIPPHDATELWNALGRPPIRWLDTNHYGPLFGGRSIMGTSTEYLQSVWRDPANLYPVLSPMHVPTFQIGAVFGLDSAAEPAFEWQAITLATQPNHMSLLHLDVGWYGRGMFFGLAVTLSGYLDAGIGRRLGGHDYRPYVGLHLVL